MHTEDRALFRSTVTGDTQRTVHRLDLQLLNTYRGHSSLDLQLLDTNRGQSSLDLQLLDTNRGQSSLDLQLLECIPSAGRTTKADNWPFFLMPSQPFWIFLGKTSNKPREAVLFCSSLNFSQHVEHGPVHALQLHTSRNGSPFGIALM